MANIKSAIKRAETNEIRRTRNVAKKSAFRTTVKNVLVAIDKQEENASTLLFKALRTLDKAVSKGLIHKNSAARKKSRLTKKMNALKSS